MTDPFYDVLIVGAGHGGAQTAIALRQTGFAGSVAIIGDEPDLPYERPPLSKEYLAQEKSFERILLRPEQFWQNRNIAMLLGRRIVAIDPDRRMAIDSAGGHYSYRHLIWSGGGSPRRLACPGHDLAGVHTVRNRADVDRMIEELPWVTTVVVIGGGYIGLEAAAALTKAGKHVVLIELLERVLARVAGDMLARFYETEHRARGVDVRLGQRVDCILGDERVTGVRLADGREIACEMVIVGIGIAPSVEPLLAAGAAGGDGVDVDGQCRTSLPGIFAIGDCAAHFNRFAGGAKIRLESVQNANDQAFVVAKTINGEAVEYDAIPWFWSNQFDLKLQTVGLSLGHDQAVLRGDPAQRSFSLIYLKQGRVVALDCVNAVKDFVQGRRVIMTGQRADPAMLANPDIPLKDL